MRSKKGYVMGVGTAVFATFIGGRLLQKKLTGQTTAALPGMKDRRGYALITGASSGIGAAYARRLAQEGYSLVLVARREDRLAALAAELMRDYTITAEALPADLSQAADIARVEQRIAKLDLSILVNNAGFGTNKGSLLASDLNEQLDMLNLHVMATMRLCRAALPGMIARERGAMINVSSISAFFPSPGDINYPASKAYMNTFSQALQAEVARHGIRVQALCPGFTHTEFHGTPAMTGFQKGRIPSVMWMTAEQVVDESLRSLERNRVICVPGRRNQLLVLGAQNGLAALVLRVARRFRHRGEDR
ncbi:MAG: SDR family oxidoreductase [Chloroflexi bacterium]|nr:SDR family oxidoreductase [Chloroflexota bacterium]